MYYLVAEDVTHRAAVMAVAVEQVGHLPPFWTKMMAGEIERGVSIYKLFLSTES